MSGDVLTLHRLRFFGHHGMLPDETEHGQEFEVTVRLELSLRAAGAADKLDRTVDYRHVHSLVRNVMEGPRRKLVETLAETLASELLRAFPLVEMVDVEVVKVRPPVGFACSGLGVRIRRARAAG